MSQSTAIITDHQPVNLAAMGLKRQRDGQAADLVTIWKTPYPVLTRYKILCDRTGLAPFAGGDFRNQGPEHMPGYITSGFRDKVMAGNKNSPHMYAFAIDIAIGNINAQLAKGTYALDLFPRIGIYPLNGFIHLDLAPECWIEKHHKARYWVKDNATGLFTAFGEWHKLLDYAGDKYGI